MKFDEFKNYLINEIKKYIKTNTHFYSFITVKNTNSADESKFYSKPEREINESFPETVSLELINRLKEFTSNNDSKYLTSIYFQFSGTTITFFNLVCVFDSNDIKISGRVQNDEENIYS